MGGNEIQLSVAQKAQLQKAVDAYNNAHKADGKKIDEKDVFTLSKDAKGNITVKVDAFGYDKGKIHSGQDGIYDLVLTLSKDAVYGAKEKDAPAFKELETGSANIAELDKRWDTDEKIIQTNTIDLKDNKAIGAVNKRFAGLVADIGADGKMALDKINDNLKKLQDKIAEVKAYSDAEVSENLATAEDKASTKKKAMKNLKQQVLNELKAAVKELEDKRANLEEAKAGARADQRQVNKEMEAIGLDTKARVKLQKADTSEGLRQNDYQEKDIKRDIGAVAKLPTAKVLEKTPMISAKNPILNQPVTQNLARAAVETAIEEYNKKNPDNKIDLAKVGQLQFDEKTGDLLIGMKDGADGKADKFFDFRMPGFYNPKSGVVNTAGMGKFGITPNEFNTATVKAEIAHLAEVDAILQNKNIVGAAHDRALADKASIEGRLKAAGMTSDEIKNMINNRK